jgi:hypothetical protein
MANWLDATDSNSSGDFDMHPTQPVHNVETIIANAIANPNPFSQGIDYTLTCRNGYISVANPALAD